MLFYSIREFKFFLHNMNFLMQLFFYENTFFMQKKRRNFTSSFPCIKVLSLILFQ